MKRRLFNLAAAASLVMMLAIAAVWLRSHKHYDRLERISVHPEQRYACTDSLSTPAGLLQFQRQKMTVTMGQVVGQSKWSFLVQGPIDNPAFWDTVLRRQFNARGGLGFYVGNKRKSSPPIIEDLSVVTIPLWLPLLVSAFVPAAYAWQRFRARRRPGTCSCCGYDLRATPDRCPECGMAVAPKPAEAAA